MAKARSDPSATKDKKSKATKKKVATKGAARKSGKATARKGPTSSSPQRPDAADRRATAVGDALRAVLTGLDGRIIELEPGRSYRFGRDESCEVVVLDSLVSRAHCRIQWDAQLCWTLSDLGSANGTWLDGERLEEPAVLADDEVLRLGGQEFRFHYLPPGVEAVVEVPDERKRTVHMEEAEGSGVVAGTLEDIDLSQLFCWFSLSRRNGILDLDEGRGEVGIVDGVPRRARCGTQRGLPALRSAVAEARRFRFIQAPRSTVAWEIEGSGEAIALAVFGPDALVADPGDLAKAAALQRRSLARAADVDGCAVGICYQGLCGVSGDFYDLTRLGDGRLLAVLGDVAGHGVQAALVVAGLLRSLRYLAPQCRDLRQLMVGLDRDVRGDLLPGQFCTAVLVALDRRDGRGEVLLAGHHPARLCEPGLLSRCLGASGPALGLKGLRIDPDRLETERFLLATGATLALFSDPLLEAADGAGREFGEHGLDEALAHLGDAGNLQQGVDALAGACRDHAGAVDDDLSILALRRS